ncbi:Ig-like domain repeat protein [Granulicella sp. dw_53]|uniref:Ig-like domain repeat protein n=1 Tax=Granulicella sp. dw_53 TaxID=2719792 RepID=UPI001BD5222D|nr:Ig-like domain repeat protein [Granulicella sp. dw_53]
MAILLCLLSALLICSPGSLQAQRSVVAARAFAVSTLDSDAITDAGPLPASQSVAVTLRIALTPERAAALDELLASQTTRTSNRYHKWITPQEFAADYGATDEQLVSLTAWAQTQGLAVASVSSAKTRVTLSGTADQVQRAFAASLHRYVVAGKLHFSNSSAPSLPVSVAPMIASVSGLDDLPTVPTSLIAASMNGASALVIAADSDPLSTAAAAIDANASPLLSLAMASCSMDLSSADVDAYHALFRQASAQGITVLATDTCTSGDATTGQPGLLMSLPEVTALNASAAAAPDASLALEEGRPEWQVAAGLPQDTLRHQPDLTVGSVAGLTQTLTTLFRETGSRQGNINSILYSLATTPGLYTQPDAAAAGTWEPATGLGVVDLGVLAKVFPRATGSFETTTTLTSSSYTLTSGQSVILTAKVLAPVYTNASPTGTVTFTSATQGTLGSATIDGTGTATLNLSTVLNVGTYSVTATYEGDTNYASSSNASAVILAVSAANGTIAASISPGVNVPYGSIATVVATVTLTGASVPPTGAVTASVQGVAGGVYSATMTASSGGNSGTANIVVAAPLPGTYTVQVTCVGNSNFVCQTPVNLSLVTVKGKSVVNVTATPAVPLAGQPVTLTANISSAGNGPGPYSFTGTMTFYDNGKVISAVDVGSNRATASAILAGNISHSIVATYDGDASWAGSTSTPLAVTPTLLLSTLSLTSNVSSALAGVNIIFTATVFTAATNAVVPTGTVSFYDTYGANMVQLGGLTGAVGLTPNGPNQWIARFTTTGLLGGTHAVNAVYSGDANFAAVTSATLPLTLADYTVTMVPQTLTLKAGQGGQAVMLVGLLGGFNGTVSFGCTPPAGTEITCAFSPASLQGGGSTTMTLTTTAAKAKPVQQAGARGGGVPWSLGAGSALAFLLCFGLPRRRRALPLLLTAFVVVLLLPGLGCGDGVNAPAGSTTATPGDPGTPLGTQVFNITTAGSDGVNTVRHTYQYQVTIQ